MPKTHRQENPSLAGSLPAIRNAIDPEMGSLLKMRRPAHDRDGVAVVEFALISPIFVVLIMAVVEIGVFFFVQSTIDQANEIASRHVRTGQIRSATEARRKINEVACDALSFVPDCRARITIVAESFDSLAQLDSAPGSPNGESVRKRRFHESDGGEYLRIEIDYRHSPVLGMASLILPTAENGRLEMRSVAIFRTELF